MNDTVTIPIRYSQRHAIEAYCIEHISPRKYLIHNQMGGEGWTIGHNPTFSLDLAGNWTIECSEHHAIIIALRYSE